MALFIPSGSVVAAINGTVDGLVYYQGHGGNVIRRWVYPANTITPQRTAVRDNFASLISLFNSLTQPMMDEWNVAASQLRCLNRLGQAYTPSGIQYFITTNMNMLVGRQLPLLLPEPSAAPPAVINFSMLITAGPTFSTSVNMYGGGLSVPANTSLIISSTDNKAAHTRSCTNRFRIQNQFGGGDPLLFDAYPQWQSSWLPSVPVSGMRLFFKAHSINILNGQATKPTYCSALVP